MIELRPGEKSDLPLQQKKTVEKGSQEPFRPPAIDDLRFFVKGSLTLFAKFVNDLDWFLARINSRNRTGRSGDQE
jgi:hypothetical protein